MRTAASGADSTVVAVVLNWCGEQVTRRCLESLGSCTYDRLEILLVDNGSPDGSGERLRAAFPDVAYLQTGSNLGYAGGNNRGIEWALERGAQQVLVLNNDTVVEPEAVSRLVQAMTEGGSDVGAVAPKILRLDDPERIWYAGGDFSALRGLGLHRRQGERDVAGPQEEPAEVTFVTGCCCLLSADALRAVGGFDESLFAYVEDVDLSLRFLEARYRLVYEPRARVLHDVQPEGAHPTPFQIRQRDRNRRRVMRRHFRWYERIPFVAAFYATRVLRFVQYVIAGDPARARAILAGAFGSDPTHP